MNRSYLIKWIIIISIPTLTALLLAWRNDTGLAHLIGGIILACEAAFLFKFVVFEIIKHHLRNEINARNHSSLLLIPIVFLIVYIAYYFGAF